MRPIFLTISAWGPYPDLCEIDFSGLNEAGIFLITGPTGAGKTTIFDALTYALYGQLSGSMRGKNTVRSDFSDPETPTFVRLSMEHGGKPYEICRNPEYQRPRKRKSAKAGAGSGFAVEKENASLKLPDGTVLAGNAEVNRKIKELLGLDYQQFRQITMIAQGEFAAFLTAAGSQKTEIFREIFGTGLYDRFARTLKERSRKQKEKTEEYRHKIQEDVRLFECEDPRWTALTQGEEYACGQLSDCLKQLLQENRRACRLAEAALEQTEESLSALSRERLLAEQANRALDRLAETLQRQEELEGREEEMRGKQELLRRASAADALRLAEAAAISTAAGAEQEGKRSRRLQEELRELTGRTEEMREVLSLEKAAEKAFSLARERSLAEAEAKTGQAAVAGTEKRLKELQRACVKKEKETGGAKAALEEAQRLRRLSAIGVAVSLLEEGRPCPVCGSLEHPHIAQLPEQIPEEEQEQELKLLWERKQEELSGLYAAAAASKEALEGGRRAAALIAERLACLKEEWGLLPAAARELAAEPLEENREAFRRRLEQARRHDTLLLEKKRQEAEQKEICKRAEEQAEAGLNAFRQALLEQEFVDEEAYRTARRSPEEQEELRQELRDWQIRRGELRRLAEHLQTEAAGQKRREMQPFEAAAAALQAEKEGRRASLEQLRAFEQQLRRTRRSLDENSAAMQREEEAYGLWEGLSRLANGENAKRLVFEQYVLAGYFERILRAANLRLRQMSEGRYELFRAKEAADGRKRDNLEITVMDYYTGKCRPVQTLSGGESFKASLSLALGMSDVMQAENGGIRVEALFIDEGFGSLDARSLDAACAVITGLAEKDRVIGIISHVEELKERIPCQIEVEKGMAGSSIRVRT